MPTRKPSLPMLSPEILSHCIQFVDRTADLLSLRLTCKQLCILSTPMLYQNVHTSDPTQLGQLLKTVHQEQRGELIQNLAFSFLDTNITPSSIVIPPVPPMFALAANRPFDALRSMWPTLSNLRCLTVHHPHMHYSLVSFLPISPRLCALDLNCMIEFAELAWVLQHETLISLTLRGPRGLAPMMGAAVVPSMLDGKLPHIKRVFVPCELALHLAAQRPITRLAIRNNVGIAPDILCSLSYTAFGIYNDIHTLSLTVSMREDPSSSLDILVDALPRLAHLSLSIQSLVPAPRPWSSPAPLGRLITLQMLMWPYKEDKQVDYCDGHFQDWVFECGAWTPTLRTVTLGPESDCPCPRVPRCWCREDAPLILYCYQREDAEADWELEWKTCQDSWEAIETLELAPHYT